MSPVWLLKVIIHLKRVLCSWGYWKQARGLVMATLEHRTVPESKADTESTPEDIKKLKTTLAKSIACCSPALQRGAEDHKRLPKTAQDKRQNGDPKD